MNEALLGGRAAWWVGVQVLESDSRDTTSGFPSSLSLCGCGLVTQPLCASNSVLGEVPQKQTLR